jgi:hypothetical protein
MRLFSRPKNAVATKVASVDLRGGRVFVNAMSRRPNGVWRVGPSIATLETLPPATELGEGGQSALVASGEIDPSDTDPFESVLEAAQVRSWSQYVKGLRSVQVDGDGDGITITRMRNLGVRHGLVPETDSTLRLADPSREELGKAVLAALAVDDGGEQAVATRVTADESTSPDPVVEFGRNVAWLALRTESCEDAARALALADAREASWHEALDQLDRAGGEAAAFVTPPVRGWTLVVLGPALVEHNVLDLASLSARFGEAQKFASRRVVDYHEWQRWVNGSPIRRYAWIGDRGEIPLDEGEPARAERGILRQADLDGDWGDARLADESLVLDLAAEWSVDPSRLGEFETSGRGLVGTSAFGRAES